MIAEADVLELAIRAAGLEADPDRKHARRRVDAANFGPRPGLIPCSTHLPRLDLPHAAMPASWSVPAVAMVRQVWREAGRRNTLIWLGQCPECRTIYYAIREA